MDEAKEVHSMLRRAAGVFTFVQTEFLPQLSNPPPLGSDLDPRVINAYVNQCTAEAQEGKMRKRKFDLCILNRSFIQMHIILCSDCCSGCRTEAQC